MSVNYDKLREDVVTQHNRIRKDPKSYIPIIEKYISYFKGNVIHKPGLDYGISTVEGKKAYLECIEFLKKQKPIEALKQDSELSRAAQDHSDDIGPRGDCDHTGSDGSDMDQRVSRYLEWDVTISENIDFGATSGEEVIVSLIVDDGVPDRGHRMNIFSPKIAFIGVGVSDHAEFKVCTVLNYIGGIVSYKNKGSHKNNTNIKTNTVPTKKNDHFKSINDEDDGNVKKLRELIINRDKSNTVFGNDCIPKNNSNIKAMMKENPFKDDPDAPEGAISCKTKVTTRKEGSKTVKKTVKTYVLDDGTEEIIEIEEISG